jgi:uncharacterized protein YndB with AHSA1/START domain
MSPPCNATLQLRRIAAMSDLGNRAVASVRVSRDQVLPTAPRRVWSALTAELSSWFGAEVDLDPRPGGRATFRWRDGWERGAVVEEADVPRRLVFRWLSFERSRSGGFRLAGPGRVEFILEEMEEGTRLTVTEWGPGSLFPTASRVTISVGA